MKHENAKAVARVDVVDRYAQRFSRGELRESHMFYKWLLGQLPVQPNARLLDIGCGSGYALQIAERLWRATAGIDLTPLALHQAKARVNKAKLACADGQALPFRDNAFELVTFIGSLEHFPDMAAGLAEAYRVVSPGGCVSVFVPNSYYLVDIVWHVWRQGRPPSHGQPIEHFGTFSEWRDLIERTGFVIIAARPYNFMFPRTRLDWDWYRAFPRKLFNLAVSPFVPFNLSYSFHYVCTKR